MFTGIIERVGTIRSARVTATGKRLVIELGQLADRLQLGASVAVNGVCLTVAKLADTVAEFDVVGETLQRSNLDRLEAGSRANLERSLRVGDPLDGHFVQGHVDGVGTVQRVDTAAGQWKVWFAVPQELADCIVPKGSIAIDGVSLTIAEVSPGAFSVALVPTTLEHTTLPDLKPGQRVNLETDLIVRTILHRLAGLQQAGGVTLDKLREHGFR
jgi:riboflavin synthase